MYMKYSLRRCMVSRLIQHIMFCSVILDLHFNQQAFNIIRIWIETHTSVIIYEFIIPDINFGLRDTAPIFRTVFMTDVDTQDQTKLLSSLFLLKRTIVCLFFYNWSLSKLFHIAARHWRKTLRHTLQSRLRNTYLVLKIFRPVYHQSLYMKN